MKDKMKNNINFQYYSKLTILHQIHYTNFVSRFEVELEVKFHTKMVFTPNWCWIENA